MPLPQSIQAFAEKHRLKITRDECGDPIIEGSRGHLYFDDEMLCLMALDARVSGMNSQQLQSLEAKKLWEGSRWRDARQRAHRDVKVIDIPLKNARLAIKLCRCRVRRDPTPAQAAAQQAGAERLKKSREAKQKPTV